MDKHCPALTQAVADGQDLIVRASPGSGKTTRLPPALASRLTGQILVLEPRRLAARLSAQRIAEETSTPLGSLAGFHIRHDLVATRETRVKFITEGLFLRYLLSDPTLRDVQCVVLDEFHERHIHSDSALALTRHLQRTTRPDLRLVVMSATLDLALFQSVLPDALHTDIDAFLHPVTIEHREQDTSRPLAERVAQAARDLAFDPRCQGNILVFLPGARDIRESLRAARVLGLESQGWDLLEFRSGQSSDEHARVFQPSSRRKVIFSTNIAETSLTLPDITGVIDSGLAKIAGQAPWSGLPTLDTRRVCQASAIQRAGRAGRTAPGVVIRLYPERDFYARAAYERPEIQRLDFSETRLALATLSDKLALPPSATASALPWLQPPPDEVITSAERALQWIGALDAAGTITPLGRTLASMPLHPRLSRVVVEGTRLNARKAALASAVLLNEGAAQPCRQTRDVPRCDLSLWVEGLLRENAPLPDGSSGDHLRRTLRQIERALPPERASKQDIVFVEETLQRALLAGFPDRVGKRRRATESRVTTRSVNLCLGGGATLHRDSCLQSLADWEFMLALDAEEAISARSASEATHIRLASTIDPAWLDALTDLPADFLRSGREVVWDNDASRVRAFQKRFFGELALSEKMIPPPQPESAALLLKHLQDQWPKPFEDTRFFDTWKPRVALVARLRPDFRDRYPDLTGEDFPFLLDLLCRDRTSFAEIKALSLAEEIRALLDYDAYQTLARLAPLEITIGAGRRAQVHWEDGKDPWIASRLQDFFGCRETPRVGEGTTPLTVHLLAPSGRPVQVTRDLASFWKTTYPSLHRELSRNYPKHYWPEDPANAEPPPANRLRPPARS
jgi:ATP-dependent helicase HrpB